MPTILLIMIGKLRLALLEYLDTPVATPIATGGEAEEVLPLTKALEMLDALSLIYTVTYSIV